MSVDKRDARRQMNSRLLAQADGLLRKLIATWTASGFPVRPLADAMMVLGVAIMVTESGPDFAAKLLRHQADELEARIAPIHDAGHG
jgi:hypothetical protein